MAEKAKKAKAAGDWVRVVTRRPGRILNRGTGLPTVKWARYRPIVLTSEELDDAMAKGFIRESDILSTEILEAGDAKVEREQERRGKVTKRASQKAAPSKAEAVAPEPPPREATKR